MYSQWVALGNVDGAIDVEGSNEDDIQFLQENLYRDPGPGIILNKRRCNFF